VNINFSSAKGSLETISSLLCVACKNSEYDVVGKTYFNKPNVDINKYKMPQTETKDRISIYK